MGCDYYIDVYLEIEHNQGTSYCELSGFRGYFCELDRDIYDSDDDENDVYHKSIEYKNLYNDMTRLSLTPRKPVVIYCNNSFIKKRFETKYLPNIQEKMNKKKMEEILRFKDSGIFTDIKEIIKVTKKELRYEC